MSIRVSEQWCTCCKDRHLIVVNGVLACRKCDNADNWPSVKKAS